MGLSSFSSVVMMMINLMLSFEGQGWWCCQGCSEEERIALLQIKTSFNYPNGTSLQSWRSNDDSDCCNAWKGVSCNSTTGRVIELDLSGTRDSDFRDWYLNASLFLPFEELEGLDLSVNHLAGCVEKEGFERLSELQNLMFLNLGSNNFNNSILTSIGGLSYLRTLYLDGNKFEGEISIEGLNNLKSLTELELGGNEIEGFKSSQGSDQLLRLSNLELLVLNTNRFNNSVLPFLKGLSSLISLDIAYNRLKGSFNTEDLDDLINLETVELSGNEIDEFVFSKEMRGFGNITLLSLSSITTNGRKTPFPLLQSLAKFPNLRTLNLDENNFEESFGTKLAQSLASVKNLERLDLSSSTLDISFLQKVGRITTLKSLSLSGCRLNGTIPTAQGLCELKQLQNLDISQNDLDGTLPWCLANLTSLQQLSLSLNHFTGNISSSPLTSLTSIQKLDFERNHFRIPISLSPFFNHSELKVFDGRENEIYVDTEEHNLTPKFQLESLFLSVHIYVGQFPKFLFQQYNLQEIYFCNMQMRGGFPNWLLENNTNLAEFYLTNSSLSGPFLLPTHPHLKLSELDVSDNYFNAHIPTDIGSYLPSLSLLSMSGNNLSGSIPSSIGHMLHLHVLDLSNNNISGTLAAFLNSSPLLHVYLSQNMLQGSLENGFRKSFNLITLDVSHNQLTGSIPEWISEIPQLSFLLLGYNNLEGRLPIQLCKLDKLSFIDLSNNKISGHILPCLRFRSSIWFYQLEEYPIDYSLPEPLEITTKSITYSYATSILYFMSGIDLSRNNLTGQIPPEIGNLNHIHLLNLSKNHLTGQIPYTFSNLSEVESLDLSNNNLNGEIPSLLVKLHSLVVFSVAHNNLSGKVPDMVAQFSTFNKSTYEDNPFLCGPPLPKNCAEEEASSSLPRTITDDKEETGFIDTSVFYMSFVVTYIIVLLAMAAALYINPNWRRAWFYFINVSINKCYYFTVDNLYMSFGFRGRKISV